MDVGKLNVCQEIITKGMMNLPDPLLQMSRDENLGTHSAHPRKEIYMSHQFCFLSKNR